MEEKGEILTISGVVEELRYRNEDNGYTVADVEADDGEFLTAVGIMPYVGEGDAVKMYGRWSMHASYGRQFSVESVEISLPVGAVEIQRYLSSGRRSRDGEAHC